MLRASLLLLVVALLAAGCGPTTGGPVSASGPARRMVEPRLDVTSPLVLEKFERRLKIGDEAAVATEVFPKQLRSFSFNDLPERLQGDFDARGWEARDEGFGAILYSGRIAAAMRQFYGISAARYEELLQTVSTSNRRVKSRSLTGENVDFTFWEAESQVLMVLRRGVRQDSYDMTIALGDRSVMEALDMTPAKAQGILDRLDGDKAAGTPDKPAVRAPTPRPVTPDPEGVR